MLNLKFIQENKDTVIRKLAVKNFDAKELVEKIIALDNERKNLQKESDDKQSEMNSISKQIGSLMKEGKKEEAENAKVSVRNARRDAIDGLKKAQKEGMPEDVAKDGETSAQKLHDKYMKKIDDMFAEKEKEILTV